MSRVHPVHVDALRCAYCHDSVVGPAPKLGCPECFAWSHQACLEELGRCANCERSFGNRLPTSTHDRSCALCAEPWTLELFGSRLCLLHALAEPASESATGAFLVFLGVAFSGFTLLFAKTWALIACMGSVGAALVFAGSLASYRGHQMYREYVAAKERHVEGAK